MLCGLVFLYWVSLVCPCAIELTYQRLTSANVEVALRAKLANCPLPETLYLNYNQLSFLPETTTYVSLPWDCFGDALLIEELNLEECQDLCTNTTNCLYVLPRHGNCSLFSSGCSPVNSSLTTVYRKEKSFMFIENFAELTFLDVSYNSLTSIPSSLKGLSRLTRLELGNNLITALPSDVFAGMTRLQILNLPINRVSSFPSSIFHNLSSLVHLNAASNALPSLTNDVFSRLSRLTVLILSFNRLQSLPPNVFRNLANLEALDFGRNFISTFPNAQLFRGLAKLRLLYFENITLTALPPDVFNGLENLRDLRFCFNELKELPPSIFGGLVNINRIEVCSNLLSSIPSDTFWNLPLQVIRLGGNRITALPPDVFQGLSSLLWLDLQGNLMRALPAKIFDSLASLTYLQMSRPPECFEQSVSCSGVVRIGSTLRSFYVPAEDEVITQAPTHFPSLSPTLFPTTASPTSRIPIPIASDEKMSPLVIGLISLAAVLCACCLIVLACWGRRRHKHRRSNIPPEMAPSEPAETQAQDSPLIKKTEIQDASPYTKNGEAYYAEQRGSTEIDLAPVRLFAPASAASAALITPGPRPSWDYESPPMLLLPAPLPQTESGFPVFCKGKYSAFRVLGKGHFGTAYLVSDPKKEVLVLKTIVCKDHNDALEEAKTLSFKTPSSLHLLKILDFFFENEHLFCIVMNYCRGGSLQTLIPQQIPLSEVERILREIATGLECLHETGLIHRDLKPDNVFLLDPQEQTVVIGDMGMARTLDGEGYYTSWFGHMLYKAPEIDDGKFSPRSDMWAVGCIGLELLSGDPLPARYHRDRLCLGKCTSEEIGIVLESLPPSRKQHTAYKMVCGLLVREPRDRLTASQLKRFPSDNSSPHSPLINNRLSALREPGLELGMAGADDNPAAPFLDGYDAPLTPKSGDVASPSLSEIRALDRVKQGLSRASSLEPSILPRYSPKLIEEWKAPGLRENGANGGWDREASSLEWKAPSGTLSNHEWKEPVYHGENGAVGRPMSSEEWESPAYPGDNGTISRPMSEKWEAPVYHGENGAVGRPMSSEEWEAPVYHGENGAIGRPVSSEEWEAPVYHGEDGAIGRPVSSEVWEAPVYHGENGAIGRPVSSEEREAPVYYGEDGAIGRPMSSEDYQRENGAIASSSGASILPDKKEGKEDGEWVVPIYHGEDGAVGRPVSSEWEAPVYQGENGAVGLPVSSEEWKTSEESGGFNRPVSSEAWKMPMHHGDHEWKAPVYYGENGAIGRPVSSEEWEAPVYQGENGAIGRPASSEDSLFDFDNQAVADFEHKLASV